VSFRYAAGINKPGYNPLAAPTYTYNLFAWGSNNSGQLGLGNTTTYSSPKQVGSLITWASLGGGTGIGFAIKTDGTLWAWGFNSSGELGLGNTTNYSSPKQVGALTNWSNISSGGESTLAVKTDGTLWSWGYNGFGTLGLSNVTDYSSPKQVGSLTTWKKVYVTPQQGAAAIKTDGTLWTWGRNNYGQLGLGNTTYYSSPKQVGALTTWLAVTGAYFSMLAVKTDGTLWSWGLNNTGMLGLNNTTYYSSPKQVGALTNWSKVLGNNGGDCGNTGAVKTDGTLWMWGKNNYGQLGLGNTTNYSSPKQVGSLTNWSLGVITNNSTAVIKTDGTFWTWGRNNAGQLGLGSGAGDRSSPTQLGSSSPWLAVAATYSSFIALG